MSNQNAATVRMLRTIGFLANVEENLLVAIADKVRTRHFKANTALFHLGEPGHVLYMVISGWVRIEKPTPSGQLVVIGRRGPGTQLGELSLLDGAPRMADAVTETDCDLISLEREDFLSFLAHSHSASLAVMSSLAEIVRSAGASLEGFGTLDAQGRLASLLLRYSEIHGTDIGTGRGNVEIKVTQQTLANHIGASRETVARLLKSMADIGAIKKDRIAIVVVDKDKLQDLVARQTSA